ncbi:hypothetical protein EVAR_64928_1 [Eumeta japonica]|uniref:Uncharacterized protein n=1 Tax=Eumeta variegata TaxID=151549 RepID=A0A4C2A077_EUMVA|nr:hypothetical protein EVAR_64928_1 [Eumeta japonica]
MLSTEKQSKVEKRRNKKGKKQEEEDCEEDGIPLSVLLRLGVTLKSVTLGNVTMSHRTRARRMLRLSHSTMIGLPRSY